MPQDVPKTSLSVLGGPAAAASPWDLLGMQNPTHLSLSGNQNLFSDKISRQLICPWTFMKQWLDEKALYEDNYFCIGLP